MRAEAQLDRTVRHHFLNASQQLIDMRFAQPIGMEPLEKDRGRRPAARQQSRDDLFFQHAPQLTRHARGEEEPRAADVHRETAGGANRIVQHLRADRQHRLLAVVRRHVARAAGEKFLHARQPFLVQFQLHAGRLRRDFLRQVIDRRTQPAIDDHRIGTSAGVQERLQQTVAVVADRGAPMDGKPDIFELLGHVAEIGVDDLAGQNFVAGADDLDAHVSIPSRAQLAGCAGEGQACRENCGKPEERRHGQAAVPPA